MSTSSRLTREDYSLQEDDWIAECLSLLPDRTLKIPRIGTAWEALGVLYLCSHLEQHYWITDDIHRMLANRAFQGNYEGEWRTVQEILEQYCQTPKEFYLKFLEFHSPEEFFGNLVPLARRWSRVVDNKPRDPRVQRRKPQRHRGYRDKGTLRPSHRPVVVPPGADEREDRRKKVMHPLLREGSENSAGEDHLPNILNGKESDQ